VKKNLVFSLRSSQKLRRLQCFPTLKVKSNGNAARIIAVKQLGICDSLFEENPIVEIDDMRLLVLGS
jgi:hypothetical protein